ncbi:hemagglutinin repeat-containing protein [Suttonella indologenes]|uniref:p120 n=1 Tax=Suttonella indologenes TaxID=13276 RepID=A0A380MIT6_9GAMM|nr:hemagglutinin repeat-containing protein [Suttonella indologenes]SUO92161.1 p120 [Suttonella indologenes]
MRFDVDGQGAIINNSRHNTATQTAGWVQGNPWLAGGEAAVIVNQVNSSAPSQLQGYVEVAGRRAEVVMANPSGIAVDGGGFINAAGVTLTTGEAVINAGHLESFRVRGGTVSISGQGLDSADADYTRVLSQAAEVNAGIWGKDITLATGQNDIKLNNGDLSVQKHQGQGSSQTVAIDSGALGGMYAGKISLISTQEGVGIHQGGRIYGGEVRISADGKLENSGEINAERLELDTDTLDNRGSIAQHGAQALEINTAALSNAASATFNGATAGAANSGTSSTASSTSAASGASAVNSAAASPANSKLSLAEGRITTRQLDNHGDISAAGGINLSTSQSLDNRGDLRLNRLDSRGLRLDNQNARITAGQFNAEALSFNNRGGQINAADFSLQLKQDQALFGTITSSNSSSLRSGGHIENRAQLSSAGTLSLDSRSLDNYNSLSAQHTRIRTDTLNNRSLIDGQSTRIDAGKVNNLGTGRIYGDHVAIGAAEVNNAPENGTTATIAARERLDIGAKHIRNEGQSLIFSANTLAIGGALDAQGHAVGSAQSLINRAAVIEALGDGHLNIDTLHNLNIGLSKQTYMAGSEQGIREYAVIGTLQRYREGADGYWDRRSGSKDQKHAYFRLNDGTSVQGEYWHVWEYDIHTHRETLDPGIAGEIRLGGDLHAQGKDWLNHDSKILIGGNVYGIGQGVLKNTATQGIQTLTHSGGQYDSLHRRGWYSLKRRDRRYESNHAPYLYSQTSTYAFDNSPHIYRVNAPNAAQGQHISTLNTAAVATDTALPQSSLYRISPNHPNYLIQTDPAFTDYRQWLGSNYMLDALNIDASMHKRLGDGFYEQRLVNEQIARLTGQRRLDGYANDEEQFKALMNAGISWAKTFNLTPGIALSAEQMAQLTSDIVWLENQTLTLPDGSRQTVLAPKVYVAGGQSGSSAATGLISAQNLYLQTQSLENSGSITARHQAQINAADIHNQGTISAADLSLRAQNRIANEGGIIAARDNLLLQAANIDLHSTTASTATAQSKHNGLDRRSSVTLSGGQGGNLSIIATDSLDLRAADVQNDNTGAATLLHAGNSLNLDTLSEQRQLQRENDAQNYRREHSERDIGSTIAAAGDILLSSQGRLNLRQAQIDSRDGQTILQGKDINISEGRYRGETTAAAGTKSNLGLSSERTQTYAGETFDYAQGSQISGTSVLIAAQNNLNIRGSDIASDNATVLSAGNDMTVSAAEESYRRDYDHQVKRSGLMGSGGIGFTIGSRQQTLEQAQHSLSHSGSSIGSLHGDTILTAANHYRQHGSTIAAPEGNTSIRAADIDIAAALDWQQADSRHAYKQSGLTVALNVPVINMLQGMADTLSNGKRAAQSGNARIQAMAAANLVWQGYQTGQTLGELAQDPSQAAKDISLSITYGEQKSEQQQRSYSTQAQSSTIYAGGQTLLSATGSGDSGNISISGSDIGGAQGTVLTAANHIRIQAAAQEGWERNSNKSSGWNAGLAVSFGSSGMAFGFTAGGNIGKGYGNGDSNTWQHSRIGHADSATLLTAQNSLALRGGQIHGHSIDIQAADLNIESLQDSLRYSGKQENLGGQITIGYGVSGSANYNRSKINADHAAVSEQSGIFAGDGGYRIDIGGHSELIGGLITSTAAAEAQGRNRFSTATLSARDLHNRSHYEGSSIGLSGGMSIGGGDVMPEQIGSMKLMQMGQQTSANTVQQSSSAGSDNGNSIGYGEAQDRQHSRTYSGINTANLHLGAAHTAPELRRDTNTEDAQGSSGALINRFDAQNVQASLDLQREVTQSFSRNAPRIMADTAQQLGNVSEYEHKLLEQSALQQALAQTDDPTVRAELSLRLEGVQQYLGDNYSRYNLWKEGGSGRAVLQGLVGGLLGGDLGSAVSSSSTSLAAPLLQEAGSHSGTVGKTLIDLGAAAVIGSLGGKPQTILAATATDWNNRQLHPQEIDLIRAHAPDFAQKQGISEEQAAAELAATALSQIDKQYAYLADSTQHYAQAQQYLKQLGAGQTIFTDSYSRQQTLFDERGHSGNFNNFAMNSEYVFDNKELYNRLPAISPLYQNNFGSEILWRAGTTALHQAGLAPAAAQKALLDDLVSEREQLIGQQNAAASQAWQEGRQTLIDANIFNHFNYRLEGINQGKVSPETTDQRLLTQQRLSNATDSFTNLYSAAESELDWAERSRYQQENSLLLGMEGLAAFGAIDNALGAAARTGGRLAAQSARQSANQLQGFLNEAIARGWDGRLDNYRYDRNSGTFIGPNGGTIIPTGELDVLGNPVFRRINAAGKPGAHLTVSFNENGQAVQGSVIRNQPVINIQDSNARHYQAVHNVSEHFRNNDITFSGEVTLRNIDDPAIAARIDGVIGGEANARIPVPNGYIAIDLSSNRQVSHITLDSQGRAGIEVKTGNAGLQRNQSEVYQNCIKGCAISVGKNAEDARLFEGAVPRSIYLLREVGE